MNFVFSAPTPVPTATPPGMRLFYSKELPESVFDLHGVHGLFLERCIEIEPKPKFDESVSDF